MLSNPVKYLYHLVIPAVDRNDPDEDGNEEEGKESRKQRRRKEEYALEVDTDGLLVIPDVDGLNLESKKSLIRTFLTRHYSKCHKSCIRRVDQATRYFLGFCRQKPKASVPWAAVRDAQDDFVESKFLPTGGKIKDPSKLQLVEADRLLEFWHWRQDKVRPKFEFQGWQKH